MQEAVTRKTGGIVLIATAVALALVAILEPPMPRTLAEYGEFGGMWAVAYWLTAVAGLLWVAGAVVLARQFNGTSAEAWATLGYGGALFAAVGMFAVSAIQVFGLHGLATGAVMPEPEAALTAVHYVMFGLGLMAIVAIWAGVGFFGLAMVREGSWPAWLGWSGLAVGVLALVANTVWALGVLAAWANALGLAWVAAAGWVLMDRGRTAAPAAAESPASL